MDTIHNVSPHLLGSTGDQSTGSTLADRAMDGFLPLPHFDHRTRPRHGSFDSQIPQIRLSQFSFPSYNPDTPENGFMPRRPRSNATLPTHIRSRSEDVYSGMHPFSSQHPSDGDSRYFHGQLLSAPGESLPSITGYGRYSVGAPSEASIYSGGGSDSQYSPYTSPSVSPQVYSTELPEDGVHGSITVPKPNVTSERTKEASRTRRKQAAKHTCPVSGCESTFTRRVNLKGHLRSHNNERPFACTWAGCDKAFARQHDCRRHEQRHAQYREFMCEGCNKQFARMEALSRHLRSDLGIECQQITERNQRLPKVPAQFIPGDTGDDEWDNQMFRAPESEHPTTTTAVAGLGLDFWTYSGSVTL